MLLSRAAASPPGRRCSPAACLAASERQSLPVTPVDTAISSVRAAVGSFHPASMPRLARAHYRREAVAWLLISTMMGAVAGGVVGVIVKNAWRGPADVWWSLITSWFSPAASDSEQTI